jgi:hypothetical protein
MRCILIVVIVLFGVRFGLAQKDTKPTTSFTISGEVKKPITIQTADLAKWTLQNIGDIVITNHLGEKKGEAKGLKGVLLKDVLGSVEINAENPKVLSEFYFVCKANDGYTVVYSWNELFNTATGNTAFIVAEKEGKQIAQMPDAILMVSASDFKTGRRHLKALSAIEVRRAAISTQ